MGTESASAMVLTALLLRDDEVKHSMRRFRLILRPEEI